MKKIYTINESFINRCREINNANHSASMSQFIGSFEDGYYVYFDAFDKKDGGYCQFVLYNKKGFESGFTDPLDYTEIVDTFELNDDHILIIEEEEV